jgi:hypothetical protein
MSSNPHAFGVDDTASCHIQQHPHAVGVDDAFCLWFSVPFPQRVTSAARHWITFAKRRSLIDRLDRKPHVRSAWPNEIPMHKLAFGREHALNYIRV